MPATHKEAASAASKPLYTEAGPSKTNALRILKEQCSLLLCPAAKPWGITGGDSKSFECMSLAVVLTAFAWSRNLPTAARLPGRAIALGCATMATSASGSPAGSPIAALGGRKLRVLALHGFAQDADSFRSKTGGFRSSVKDLVEFEYALAPFLDSHDLIGEGRTWYMFSQQDTTGDMTWGKFDETLSYLSTVFKEKGPFDGVLGFSQGACLAATLACMQGKKSAPEHVNFKFVGCLSGFVPRDPSLLEYVHPGSCELPSFHCIGETDAITPPARSEALCDCFVEPVLVRHAKGHMVPSERAVRDTFREFVIKQIPDAAGGASGGSV